MMSEDKVSDSCPSEDFLFLDNRFSIVGTSSSELSTAGKRGLFRQKLSSDPFPFSGTSTEPFLPGLGSCVESQGASPEANTPRGAMEVPGLWFIIGPVISTSWLTFTSSSSWEDPRLEAHTFRLSVTFNGGEEEEEAVEGKDKGEKGNEGEGR